MAAEMLNACLTGELNIDKLTKWLTAGNYVVEPLCSSEYSKCDKGNFVLYFLKYLRDETAWLLRTSPGQTSGKEKVGFTPEKGNSRRKSRSSKVELFPTNDGSKNKISPNLDKHFQNISGANEVEIQLCGSTPIKRVTSQCISNETKFGENVRNSNSKGDISGSARDYTPVKKFNPLATSSADSSPVHQMYSPLHRGWQDPSFCNGLDNSFRDKTPVLQKTNKLHSPLHLGDFIVEESFRTSNKKKSNNKASSQSSSYADASNYSFPKRRIKPTQLHIPSPNKPQLGTNDEMDFGMPNRPSEPGTPFIVDNLVEEQLGGHKNFKTERDLLRQERLKLQNNVKHEEAVVGNTDLANNQHLLFTPSKLASMNNFIIPQCEMVTHSDKLSILSCLYCFLLNKNLVPSISVELHFIVSILTSQVSDTCLNENSPFGTVHNCVKFASSVLQNQCQLLELTDTATLQMLSSNSRLAEFAPELQVCLSALVNRTENYPKTPVVPTPSVVAFHPDTDNRSNFPNDQSFHAFRKQRDVFYEILSKWEQSHEEPGWNFSAMLGHSVKMLLSLHNEPSNYIHLSRLFRMQLLTTCIEESKSDIEFKDGDNEMLSVLKDANPKKYALLYARLVTPVLNSRGPCPPPSFPGHQEFFHNFVMEATCSIFKQHLSDGFINELQMFNSKNFSPSDVGDSDDSVDEETKQDFLTCLSAMKLLSKFLGFVNCLPYYSSIPYSEKLIIEHCSIRSKVNPVLDIIAYIQEAKQEQKLVYSIPWIVEYLAIMDAVTLRIPYYLNVLRELVHIYCNISISDKYTAVLVKLCLGWLFELPNFPDGLFFSSISNLPISEVCAQKNMTAALDSLGLVDQRMLYICCPFWGAIKSVLANDPGSRNHITLRHITPVPADLQVKTTVSSSKQLQLQMEECFFHGHPASMRKSVEFVAERVASSFVKHICNKILAEQKAHSLSDFKKHVVDVGMDNLQISNDECTFESTRNKLTRDAESIATRSCISLKNTCKERLEGYCKHRISDALCSLLPEDIQEQVLTVCSQIAFRLCSGKISNWLRSHVTVDLFLKDFQGEINRTLRGVRDDTHKVSHLTSASINLHDYESVSPHIIMNKLRKILLTLITEQEFSMTDKELICFLKEIKRTLQTRDDVIFTAEKTINNLTVEMFLLLASNTPEKITSNVQSQFVTIWKLPRFEKNCFLNLLCPRNLNLLSKTRKPKMEHCWSKMAELVSLLLNESFLTSEQLEDQCVAVFREPWDQDFLKQFASCIREVVRRHHSSGGGAYDEFVLLMELVSELCDDIENFDVKF